MSIVDVAYGFAALAVTAFVAVLAWLAWDEVRHTGEGEE